MSCKTLCLPLLAALLLGGCAAKEPAPADKVLATGRITEIGGHGNAYTDIRADAYAGLGLKAGDRVQLVLPDTAFVAAVGEHYTSVPSGQPVVVLHPEGLTLAVRDAQFAARYSVAPGDAFQLLTAPTD